MPFLHCPRKKSVSREKTTTRVDFPDENIKWNITWFVTVNEVEKEKKMRNVITIFPSFKKPINVRHSLIIFEVKPKNRS